MIEKAEAIRGLVVDIVTETTGLSPVFLSPPEFDPTTMPEGDHVVVLMRTDLQPDSLTTAELLIEFSVWVRYRRSSGRPIWDLERRRLEDSAAILTALQSSRVAFRAVGQGYLPRPTTPFNEADVGTLGDDWAENVIGYSVRTEVTLA